MSEAARTTTMLLDAGPFLPPLARRLAAGDHADLLAPYRLVAPACPDLPPSPAAADGSLARRRAALAEALVARNRELGHPRADELAARFGEATTRVVVTGQQPGLFGGPLYSLSKLLAAQRWSEVLDGGGRGDARAVAVFWMATEDHDFAEVAHARFPLGEGGTLETLELPDDGHDLVPVGRRRLGPGVEPLLERLRAAATTERQARWVERLAAIYRPERTFGEAFAGLMIELLGARCPLFVDALDPAFKAIQHEVTVELVERREAVTQALAERHAEVERRGLPLQVAPQPDCSPLFLLTRDADGEEARRRRLQWTTPDGWSVRGGDAGGSIDQLLARIAAEPEAASPGVLARPVVQDAMLGPSAFLVGPGELSYLIQASALHPVLEVAAPAVALRPQLMLIDERRQGRLAELMARGLDPVRLLGPEEEVVAALAAVAGEDPTAPLAREVLAAVDRLREPARAIEPQLEGSWEKTRAQVERALEAFAGRVEGARARADGVLRQRVEGLRHLCLPDGVLQERRVCVSHFPGLYGADVAYRLLERLEPTATSIQLLDPTEEAVVTAAAARET